MVYKAYALILMSKKDDITFTIGVSETAYYSHEVNDTIKLSIYHGAFNEPYYMHEENKN